ncbi:hypothetical protein, conserved [Babesia bigemina]|nr:hypothetical protein, conserved [Babesia bigemina]CDR71651.1 hypothetical protein, conserved [Babesia bigemina]|eukprot:XP_012770598.1 hypothetical protein, conserved [Babesia bigemina]
MNQLESTVSAIEGKLQENQDLRMNDPSSSTYQYYLKHAVTTILTAVRSAANGAKDDVEIFMSMSNIAEKLQKAIRDVKNLGSNMKDAVYQSSSGQLGTLGQSIKGDVGTAATNNEVEKQLETLLKTMGEKAVAKLQSELKAPVIDKLEGIRNDVDDLVNAANKSQSALFNKAQEVTSHVASLCHAIKQAAGDLDPDGLKNKLKDLTNLINTNTAEINGKTYKGLNKIHTDLGELRNLLLSDPIQKVQQFIKKEVTLVKAQIVTDLHRSVNNEVQSAIEKLTTEARKQYVTSVKGMVTAFAEKVHTELHELPAAIERDKHIGFKGFMGKMEKGLVSKVKYIKDINSSSSTLPSPVSKAARIVRDGVRDFVELFEKQEDIEIHKDTFQQTKNDFNNLLRHVEYTHHFDHMFTINLDDFEGVLRAFTPEIMDDPQRHLLTPLKRGLLTFVDELSKRYVNKYSGKKIQWTDTTNPKKGEEPTADATNCAKAFLTTLEILSNDFHTMLTESVKSWKGKKINTYADNVFGLWLEDRGYKVNAVEGEQTGELQDNQKMSVTRIYDLLNYPIGSVANKGAQPQWVNDIAQHKKTTMEHAYVINVVDVLHYLYGQTKTYYEVCHSRHIERPKSPSSVYQMLAWLTGLPHNRVFQKVSVGDIGDLFEKPDEDSKEAADGPIPVVDDETLKAHPDIITASNLSTNLRDVCVYAEDVLIGILGHGHADGIYAVDFNTNPDGFSYPTAPGACFDMLCDVLNRLYQQLFFLYGQCSNEEPSVSWRDCWYGNQVGGSAWNCNTMQCPNQKGNQIHKQKCNQKCDQTAQCGIKSPLQCFLEDGLPGFLPHSFSKPGCKLTCTLSNHGGIPCRTPMGFADISVTASHRQTGEYLKKVLEGFCGSESAPLTKLCAQLTCLLQKPPQTLGDIFAFYYGYITDYTGGFYGVKASQTHTQQAFREAVNAAYFGTQYGGLDPSILLDNRSHRDAHSKGDLISISSCTSASVVPCGLYVKSLTQEITRYYSAEHKANHLSWIVYITETFCDLLKKLYDDCCKKCGPAGSKCHVKSCVENCRVKYTDSTGKPTTLSPTHNHSAKCKSIVTCRDTHPTLYRYGFTFGHPWGLNGSGNNEGAKRTCRDFCEALKKMLGENSVLIQLRHQIDKFLWDIREKFSITVLALWLLSFLYLLHIMVIRLDLLHIKSHLHSPSSHRIAAQSLLAAARVNKLNKVFYLQP